MAGRVLKRWHPGILLTATLAMAFAYLLASNNTLQRIDYLVYDYFLRASDHRASELVTIVAIDDLSLQRLGRWPWSRRVHARMLERLTEAGARAVGYDVLFAEFEEDDSEADRLLAEAMQSNGRTVLAVAPSHPIAGQSISEVLPIPSLAASAAALGHADVEVDVDGLSRSFFLYAGLGTPHWPAFALAIAEVGGGSGPFYERPVSSDGEILGWARSDRYFVPFDARRGAIRTVSFQQVLEDDDLAETLGGQYVLVGAIAAGLGDFLASPVSLEHRRMPGVELSGHILSGILGGRLAREIDSTSYRWLSAGVALLSVMLLLTPSYRTAVVLFPLCVALVLALTAFLLVGWQIWFPPSAAIAPIILGFPLWGAWTLVREIRINRNLEVRIEHQALHHATTDLPNQFVLDQQLRQLQTGDQTAGMTALVIVHVKWSGAAGEIVGRLDGDELLRTVATRLGRVVRSGDLVAHLNSDDFGILLREIDGVTEALDVANNLVEALREPLPAEDSKVFLVPRIGLSLWPEASADGNALLRDAYIAMFRARIEHSPVPCVFSNEIAREVHARSRLEQALIYAIERREFEVYYQPQVDASGIHIIGLEALLRWHNPELGLVFPGTFIPVAEHTGLIQTIGTWVLHTACEQTQRWNASAERPIRLAVNLSPLQFADEHLVEQVESALAESGLDPRMLELEITESTLMHNLEEATSAMRRLKQLGIGLAIDDFGTGYSSLSNLQHFPLDRIKIDQSFTREIAVNDDVREITATIISMAKRLKLDVIAEGVETQDQAAILKQQGCDELQGFYFSQPMPARDITFLLGSPSRKARGSDRRVPPGADVRNAG